ncbi:MAG: AsmA-like C-terminal region-containing protein [Bacteroidota bacterium]
MNIKAFSVDKAKLNILINNKGEANYDIAKKDPVAVAEEKTETTSGKAMVFSVEEYEISESKVVYYDEESNMKLSVSKLNHSGSGDLSASQSKLKTKTNALVSFKKDSIEYLGKNMVDLDALIQLDLEEGRYSFLENKALINQLPLVFDGFVKINESDQEVDVTFKTPSSDFKNFLGLIPTVYTKNLENVKTSGNFEVKGFVKGIIDDSHIPTFSIVMLSDNASFKYPDLPKEISNINISTLVGNKTGIMEDTYVNIDKLSFMIDQDVFNASAKIRNIIENPFINAEIRGRLNLANLTEAYPVDYEGELSGILNADISTAFDMNSIEENRYENTSNKGSFSIHDLKLSPDEMANPIEISKADITFNDQNINLNGFSAKTGLSDIKATGTIKNLLGFMFNNEDLEGNFDLNSGTFAVNDFMMKVDESETGSESETVKSEGEKVTIPAFLDCTINAVADNVIYDDLTLKKVKGTIKIEDQKATITNLTSELFDGQLGLTGNVSTKEETPTFNMNLKLKAFDITSSFKELELFQFLTPLANAVNGIMNSDISLSGNLNEDFTPNMATLSGDLLGEILNASFVKENSPLLQSFDQNMNFIDLSDIELKNLKTSLSFKDGNVNLKPINLKYKDIDIEVKGTHSLDKSLSYMAKLDVPAKYLGKDVNKLLANLSEEEASKIRVPVNVEMGGSFTNPTLKTDVKSSMSNLTQQLISIQKDKLTDKGKGILTDMLNNNITKDSDSTKKEDAVKEAAKGILGNLFGKKKDSTQN